MTDERSIRIAGVQSRVPVVCDFVADAAREAGLDDRAIHHCQLAVDECCTNIIEHGYLAETDDQPIEITCRVDEGRFAVSISDEGPPFDPLQHADPDRSENVEEREPGGWGIHLIKRVMDEVYYRFEDRRNTLVLVKHVQPHEGLMNTNEHVTKGD